MTLCLPVKQSSRLCCRQKPKEIFYASSHLALYGLHSASFTHCWKKAFLAILTTTLRPGIPTILKGIFSSLRVQLSSRGYLSERLRSCSLSNGSHKKVSARKFYISRRSTWPSFYYLRSFFHLSPILLNCGHLSLTGRFGITFGHFCLMLPF